jgi:hypothetical protein
VHRRPLTDTDLTAWAHQIYERRAAFGRPEVSVTAGLPFGPDPVACLTVTYVIGYLDPETGRISFDGARLEETTDTTIAEPSDP